MNKWEYKIVNVGTNDLVEDESLILKELVNNGWN